MNLKSPTLSPGEQEMLANVIQSAAEAQDRMADTSLGGREDFAHPNTIHAMDRHGLTDAEMGEFRRLKGVGLLPTEAAGVIIRSRRGDRT